MRKKLLLLATLFLVLFSPTAWSQVASYSFTQTAGTYTAITGGTVLGTATANSIAGSLDNQIFTIAAASFPFSFTFNGVAYTGCNVSTNGFITFGATAPATNYYTPISGTTAYASAISAWGGDLNSPFNVSAQTGEMRWQVVGTAPNREIVFQWKNFRPSYSSSITNVYAMNFQIRLAETTNVVSVVYGAGSYLVGSATISSTREIGLRGATNADFNNRLNASTLLFTASTAGTANSSTQAFNTTVATPGMPSSGLTYRWTPPVATDAQLSALVAPSTTQTCFTATENVTVAIRNAGTSSLAAGTAINVTVNVTGAATSTLSGVYTVPAGGLASFATVNFIVGTLNMTTVGIYNFAASLTMTGDLNALNNALPTVSVNTSVTIATLPQVVPFTGFTGANLGTPFIGWSEAAGTTPSGTTSSWTSQTGLGSAGNTTARINLYGTIQNEWIISPVITPNANTRMSFDAAVSDWNSTTVGDVMGADDMVRVMVSVCGGAYTPILTLNAATGLTLALQNFTVDLSPYAGQNIRVAFYATDGPIDNSEDYDFHLDNINIREVFPNDVAFSSLVAPSTSQICFSNAENVTVSLQNAGSAVLSAGTIVPVTVNVTGAVTQTINGNYTVPAGGWASGAFINFTVGTLNMTTIGTYTFNGSASMGIDMNTANNNLTPAVNINTNIPISTLPQVVPFTGFTGANLGTPFPGWFEASGTTPTGTTSNWISQTGLGGAGNITARVNLYTTTGNEWIISPIITPEATTRMTFDAAVSNWGSTTVNDLMGADDMVRVMVSVCGGAYTPIFTLNAATGLTLALQNFTVNLGAYAGQNIRVAFYATDGPIDNTEDYDFHLDNINICTLPTAPVVTGLGTVVGSPICPSTTSTLTATGVSGGTFQWYNAATGGTLLFTGAAFTTPSLTTTTTYFVQQSTSCAISPRTSVTVNVSDAIAPTLSACPVNQTFCSAVPVVATWTTPTVTDNCTSGIIPTSTFASGATFPVGVTTVTYTATDAAGNASTCSFTITVNAVVAAPAATNGYTCFGATGTPLTATGPSISWFSDAALTTLVGTGSPFTPAVTAPGLYTFYATQTISGCQSLPKAVTYTIINCIPPPSVPSYLIVEGQDTKTLKIRFPDANSDEDGYELYRSLNGTSWAFHRLITTTVSSEIVVYDSLSTIPDQAYYYIVRAKRGATRSPYTNSAYDFTYPEAPSLSVLTPACYADAATIKAVGTHVSNEYRWYQNATTTTPISGNNGVAFSGDLYTTPQLIANTTYYVTAQGRRYESKPRKAITVNVIVRPVITIVGAMSQRACGTSIALAIEPISGVTYSWAMNGVAISGANSNTYNVSADGVYTVAVNNGSCATVSSPIYVDVLYKPTAMITQGKKVTFCESGVLNAKVITGADYEWYNGTTLLGSGASVIVNTSGTYTLKAIEFGCENTTNIEVSILSFPTNMDLTADRTEVCVGEKVTLTAPIFTTGVYNWLRNGRVFRTTTTNSTIVTQAGDYAVQFEHNTSCVKTGATTTVVINAIPTLTHAYDAGNLVVTVQGGATTTSLSWTIDGIVEPSLANKLTFKPTKAGLYELTAVFSTGCEAKMRVTITMDVLGTEDEDGTPTIANWIVYPNPTSSLLFVNLENAKAEEVSLVLTDNLGRQVIKQVSRQSEGLSLDLSKMAAGVYMLNVKVGESNKTFKIVKAD